MPGHTGDPVKDLLAGGIAGSANITTGFPFDTVKVRLQASPAGTYRGAFDCCRSILRFEGFRGLYRGLAPPLIGGAIETAINYAVYTAVLDMLTEPGQAASLGFAIPVAAGTAGIVLSVALSPFELIKCRMQMGRMGQHHHYSSSWACARHLIRTEGTWGGLTRGMGATMARECPGNAVFFTAYEALRRAFPGKPQSQDDSILAVAKDSASAIACGGAAGTLMWATVLPLDVAKTRIQTAFPGSVNNVGILRNIAAMWRTGGVKALWAGVTPTLIRAFPANAAQWLCWELSIRRLDKL